jgi:hypothetical protein
MNEYISFHKVLDYIEQFQEESPIMNSYGYGNLVDFTRTISGNTQNNPVQYPYLFAVPQTIEYSENTTIYQVSLLFTDIINTDYMNEKDIISDMSLQARRFLSYIKRGIQTFPDLYDNFDIELPVQAIPFMERMGDHVAGVAMDVNLIVFEDINACDYYPTPTPTVSTSPTPTPTITPTTTLTETPTNTPTETPTNTPTPTVSPQPSTITYITGTSTNLNATSYTFSNVDIGGPGLIVVSYSLGVTTTRSFVSASIGGISAPLITGISATNSNTGIISARVNSGITADIVFTFNNSASNISIGVYRIENNISDSVLTTNTQVMGGSKSIGGSLTGVSANTLAIAVLTTNSGSSGPFTWGSATENYDSDVEITSYSGASTKILSSGTYGLGATAFNVIGQGTWAAAGWI